MIEGVLVVPLRQIPDERGTVKHMLRRDAPHFQQFGEIYFSTTYPGMIKAWKIHKRTTLNLTVVVGMLQLVLYDAREASPTKGQLQEVVLGDDNYMLVRIPPGVVSGWKCIGNTTAILANCATEPHDPDEVEHIDIFSPEVPYNWFIRPG